MAYDVIVVLGGGINGDSTLPEKTRYRVHTGADLLQRKYAPRILMSGDRPKHTKHSISEAELMRAHAVKLGVSPTQIFLEQRSFDTVSNAECTKQDFLEPNKWKNIVLVTSDFHLPRAAYIFEKALREGYAVMPVPAPSFLSRSELERMLVEEEKKLEEIRKRLH